MLTLLFELTITQSSLPPVLHKLCKFIIEFWRYFCLLVVCPKEFRISQVVLSDVHLSDKLSGTGSVHDLACLIKLLRASESEETIADVLPGITGLWPTFTRPLNVSDSASETSRRTGTGSVLFLIGYWPLLGQKVQYSFQCFIASRAGLGFYLASFLTPATFTF